MREGPPPKRIPLVDDVLDWLSDKGGYTGFTEEQLRSGEDLRNVDMESFGEGTKVDNATTEGNNATSPFFYSVLRDFLSGDPAERMVKS